tara:strand:- start:351 stop:2036 length:1686 start_codon:yes stop_codon:yes gene_type:complete
MADVVGPGGNQAQLATMIEMQKGFDSMASSVGLAERKIAGLRGAIRGMPFVKMVIGIDNYRKSLKKSLHNMGEWHQLSDKEKKKRKENMTIMQKILVPMLAYSKIGKGMNKITATSNTLLGRFTARLFGLFAIFLVIGFALAIVSLAFDDMNSPVVQLTQDIPILGGAVEGLVVVLTGGEEGEGGLAGALNVLGGALIVFGVGLMVASWPVALLAAVIFTIVGVMILVENATDSLVVTLMVGVATGLALLAPYILYLGATAVWLEAAVATTMAYLMGGVALILLSFAAAWAVATGWGTDLQAFGLTIIGIVAAVVGTILLVLAGVVAWPAVAVAAIIAVIVFAIAWIYRKRDEIWAALIAFGDWLNGIPLAIGIRVAGVINNIRTAIPIVIRVVGSFMRKLKSKIKSAVVDFIKIIKDFVLTVKNTPGSIWTKLKAGLRELALQLGRWYNDHIAGFIPEFTVPDWVPGVGGNTMGPLPPEIPHLAKGGIVTRPTLALIGEAGPEAVVPLGKGGGMGNTFNINIDVSGVTDRSDKRALAMQISDEIQKEMRRYGRGTTRRGY